MRAFLYKRTQGNRAVRVAAVVGLAISTALILGCSKCENRLDDAPVDSSAIECVCPDSEIHSTREGVVAELSNGTLVLECDAERISVQIAGHEVPEKAASVASMLEQEDLKQGDKVLVSFYGEEGDYYLDSVCKLD